MKYTCTICGREHNDWPALGFDSTYHYHNLSDIEKETIAQLTPDFCIITYEDQTDRFIRCTLTQKVNDSCQHLDYGIWVSLSEKSFNDYQDNFDNKEHGAAYFGYICNNIPGYDSTLSIPSSVETRTEEQRPDVVPDPNFDHPFVKDYYSGISIQDAEERIKKAFG